MKTLDERAQVAFEAMTTDFTPTYRSTTLPSTGEPCIHFKHFKSAAPIPFRYVSRQERGEAVRDGRVANRRNKW
jgi:hypothetical protein